MNGHQLPSPDRRCEWRSFSRGGGQSSNGIPRAFVRVGYSKTSSQPFRNTTCQLMLLAVQRGSSLPLTGAKSAYESTSMAVSGQALTHAKHSQHWSGSMFKARPLPCWTAIRSAGQMCSHAAALRPRQPLHNAWSTRAGIGFSPARGCKPVATVFPTCDPRCFLRTRAGTNSWGEGIALIRRIIRQFGRDVKCEQVRSQAGSI